jgi:hypothetical protein
VGLFNAMNVLADQWESVQHSLPPDQASRLREQVVQFATEADSPASARAAERVMDLLVEWLPVNHPVLLALAESESRSPEGTGPATDRAWTRLAEILRAKAGPPGTTFGDDDDS